MIQENIHTDSFVLLEEGVTVDGGGKETQKRMADSERANVTAKKEAEKLSNADKNKVDKKESRKNHALLQSIRHTSVYLIHL